MMLSVGIIGLPNVGKSTLFNALTSAGAEVSNYPFTTIDSNVGVVSVPDLRLDRLVQLLNPEEIHPATVQFIDIAGLVRGASRGEGLGNQFLANIRAVDAVAHVVRCFREADVAHVEGELNPARDVDVVETELLLADLELVDRIIEKRRNVWKTSPRQYAGEEERLSRYRTALASGVPLRSLPLSDEDRRELKGLGLLTGKPIFYIANVSEDDLADPDSSSAAQIRRSRLVSEPEVVVLSARLEWELQQLEPEEREEFRRALGIDGSRLNDVVATAYRVLGLITFYTIAHRKVSAWAVTAGTPAPEAAGRIHSDMEKGFIRAQVVPFHELERHPSVPELHRLGLLRTEGKDYLIQDGDVVEFLFSS
ncbi:MAG TPA: redox-regulated ATPase YchF [Acidobacteriota bacterium]|nr:redox-regulated ATPase YchF [Acidobacteriota bacterium]